MQHLPVVRVHSRILDCRHEEARLFYGLRWMDSNGAGRVFTTPTALAGLMNVSPQTIYRWLKAGDGLFWRHRRSFGGQMVIYLSSLPKVACALGVSSLGAIAEVELDQLTRMGSKALCTALEAIYRQKQAYWAAKKQKKGQAKKLILDPQKQASSDNFPGALGLAVASGEFQIPGCSISGLAKSVDYSEATIKRRLDNRWRKDRDLECVQKKRVAKELDDPGLAFAMAEAGQSFLVTQNAIGHTRVLKVLIDMGRSKLVQLGCNIYNTGHELMSCRSQRRKFRALSKALGN